jgi:hypothetical protein
MIIISSIVDVAIVSRLLFLPGDARPKHYDHDRCKQQFLDGNFAKSKQ